MKIAKQLWSSNFKQKDQSKTNMIVSVKYLKKEETQYQYHAIVIQKSLHTK